MKRYLLRATFAMVLFSLAWFANGQQFYRYDSVPGDPLKVRIYTLDNGLRVFLTVYKDSPRIQTAIAVRTGSKNDPSDNTGLSHYLEHMMFKGSDEFGTKDFAAEKVLLDQVEQQFEVYRRTTDPASRNKIYKVIDSLSQLAAQYSIANEYDKLLSAIGARNTNAFTSFEETVYINDIPSNKTDPWLQVEYERFRDPVFRLFHTELETVYEEKNMSLDNDDEKIYDSLMLGLFPTHPYGTQTTIGTTGHLKNPSLTALKNYYAARYVPNNMAILMAGDFDPDETIRLIDATFGKLPSKPLTSFQPPLEKPILQPVVREVVGPDAASVAIGFRMGGSDTRDADLLTILNQMLYNEQAGLMDINLNQAQKVLESSCFPMIMKDYSAHVFSGKPKEGQTLEEVKDLILAQIDMIRQGKFPDWMLPAIINNLRLQQIKGFETNSGRVFPLVEEFVLEQPHSQLVQRIDRLAKITRQDIIDFAGRVYGENYVVVYKRTGMTPETAKIIKPAITPVPMNRDDESAFLRKIMAMPAKPVEPVFLDYKKDLLQFTTETGIPVVYRQNEENQLFSIYFLFRMGSDNDRKLTLALDYFDYLGTSKYSRGEIREEFYKLGCSFNINSAENEIWISLQGLSENMTGAMSLLRHYLTDLQPETEALTNLVRDLKKMREDEKLSKETILWQAMYTYGIYGPRSPFTHVLSSAELDALKADDLVAVIKGLMDYEHEVLYYGPLSTEDISSALNKEHRVASPMKPVPPAEKYAQPSLSANAVYTVDYDMKQAEIIMVSKSTPYDAKVTPMVRLFNEYFGGSMNSIVFQEIRESKGLAYSAYAGYRQPPRPDMNYFLFSYVGTQNDKLPEAMKAMTDLFNNMPESENAMNACKEAIINKIRTERITKAQILFNFVNARKFGIRYDIRKDVYEQVPRFTFTDLRAFQQKYLKDQYFNILILGNEENLDMKTLSGYGAVRSLKPEEIFGY